MIVVYCRGGDKFAPKLCADSGMAYGTRHDYTPYMEPVYMLDINWEAYNWFDYLSKVERYKPAIAMVPDYEHPHQRGRLMEQIEEVKAAGAGAVMCCPKFLGAVADIPSDCILAISVPTKYAGFLPDASEVEGRKLHLLGGQPDQQLYIIRKLYQRAQVVSVDGNKLALKAQLGQWWSARRANWVQTAPNQYSNQVLMLQSARRIMDYFSNPRSFYRWTRPVLKCAAPKVRQLEMFG